MRNKAFTLIELLVVIAIIAILAAILFPVFAQAKLAAKRTQTLSQFKQVGTSVHIYISDADDVFPLAMSYSSAANQWRSNAFVAVPNGWSNTGSPARDTEPRKTEEYSYVLNACGPYIKNLNVFEGAGMNAFNTGNFTDSPNNSLARYGVNITFNGQLHAWSATAVAQPSKLPLMVQAYKENNEGKMISLPQLCCTLTNNPTCQFNAGGYPQSGQTSCAYYGQGYGYVWFLQTQTSNFSLWTYGRGMPFVSADSSARMIQFNAPKWPQYAQNVNSNPWSPFDPAGPEGSPYWMTDCVSPGASKGGSNIYYAGYFRPDSEYTYTLQQCDFGGG